MLINAGKMITYEEYWPGEIYSFIIAFRGDRYVRRWVLEKNHHYMASIIEKALKNLDFKSS